MATGIRQKRIGRGASSSTGAMSVRSAPTVQNTVIPKRGLVTYNPLEGLGQVGAGFATRIEQMGRDTNAFFKSLSGTAMKAADVEHRVELVKIKEENERQQAQAIQDEMTNPGTGVSMPGMKSPDLEFDNDYYETRLKIRAQNHAAEVGGQYVETELNNLPLGTDIAQHLAEYTSKAIEGMDPHYSTYFTAALRDKVKPSIDAHITDLYKADELGKKTELSRTIQSTIGIAVDEKGNAFIADPANVAEMMTYGKVQTLMRDARQVLGGELTDGQVKSWVIGQMISGLKNAENPHNEMSNLLTQLGNDKDFGDGTKTFRQLYPDAYQNLAKAAEGMTNDALSLEDSAQGAKIEQTLTRMLAGEVTPTQALSETIADPAFNDLYRSEVGTKTRAQFRSLLKAVAKKQKDGQPLADAMAWVSGEKGYNQDSIKKLDGGAYLNTPSGMNFLSQAIRTGHGGDFKSTITNQAAAMTDGLNVSGSDEVVAAANMRAFSAYSVMKSASDGGASDSELSKLYGQRAMFVFDRARDAENAGQNVEQALQAAAQQANLPQVNKNLAAIETRDITRALRQGQTGSSAKTDMQLVAAAVQDHDKFEKAQVSASIHESILEDIKYDLAVSGESITKENVDNALERAVERIADQYAVAPGGVMLPNSSASPAQRASLFRQVDGIDGFTAFEKNIKGIGIRKVPIALRDMRGQPRIEERDSFLKGIIPSAEDARLDVNNTQSRVEGGAGVLDGNNHKRVVIAPNISTPYKGVPSQVLTRDDDKTLTIVPDNYLQIAKGTQNTGAAVIAAEMTTYEDAMENGGVVTRSTFIEGFNNNEGREYGFTFRPRQYAQGQGRYQNAYVLEYDSTVLTKEEAADARAAEFERLKKEGRNLTNTEVTRARFAGVVTEGKTPKAVREELEQKGGYLAQRRTTREERDAARAAQRQAAVDRWDSIVSFVTGLFGSDPEQTVTNSVGRADLEHAQRRREGDRTSDDFNKMLDGVINQGKKDGTISPSVGVTTFNIPDRIDSAEQLAGVIERLIHSDGVKSKAGLPNEPLGTPVEKSYITTRNKLITAGEGIRDTSYMDTSGVPTVGIGFNLEDPVVKPLLTKMLGEDTFKKLVEEAPKANSEKTVRITEAQMDQVFEAVLADKEALVSGWYKDVDLTAAQRAVIVDLAYQGGSRFVGPKTNFYKAVRDGDWDTAIDEVRYRSNRNNVTGIQNRMNHRADILANVKTDKPLLGSEREMPTTDWVDRILTALNPISTARAGTAQAAVRPTQPVASPAKQEVENGKAWLDSTVAFLADQAESIMAHTAQNAVSLITPTDSSELLISDWIVKNKMDIPVDRKTMTESDLKVTNLVALRAIAKQALAKGKQYIEWSDYGNDSLGNPVSGIIGGDGVKDADRAYPKTLLGIAKLGLMTMIDPKVDTALTIGQASITIDDNGDVIVTDQYDAERFIYGSRSKGAYGAARNFLGQEGRLTTEGGESKPISWRINLGKLS